MPTTKSRLNITLTEEVEQAVAHLAKRDRVPQATKAAELLKAGLEAEEDDVLSLLAAERDTADAKFIPHDKAWQ